MVKILVNEEPLNTNTGRYNKTVWSCTICDDGPIEDAQHMIFSCRALHDKRTMMFTYLHKISGRADEIITQADVTALANAHIGLTEHNKLKKLGTLAQLIWALYHKRTELSEK